MTATDDKAHDPDDMKPARKKNRHAVTLGRAGGKASARKLTPEQRKDKARHAIKTRWARRDAEAVKPSGSPSPSPHPES